MPADKKMPVLFVGHGNPMHAITSNAFTEMLARLGREIPGPKAILCVSAHWMTEGTWVTGMERPRTIHDFYGFPKALSEVRYPAPGSPSTAAAVQATVTDPRIELDPEKWGLDHGSWAVLKHMYPRAEIPVVQLSVYMRQPGPYHLHLGERLRPLRDQGILILGSGNIVHNLREMDWNENAKPQDWALEFDSWSKEKLLKRDFRALSEQYLESTAGKLSVPTPDHYFPLLTVLGASTSDDALSFEFEEIQNASISMRAVSFGLRAS